MWKYLVYSTLLLSLFAGQSWANQLPNWQVDPTKSSLTFKIQINGQTVTGRFPGFGSIIRFDPANLSASTAKVIVDTTGIKTRDATRDAMLLKPAWFNVLDFPQATFQSTTFQNTGGNKFICVGNLTIKGITKTISLPFTLDIKGNTATMKGTTIIKRLDYKIGEGADYKTGVPVSWSVAVIVNITAKKTLQ